MAKSRQNEMKNRERKKVDQTAATRRGHGTENNDGDGKRDLARQTRRGNGTRMAQARR